MRSCICSAIAVILVLTGPALAGDDHRTLPQEKGLFDFQGTSEEQTACAADANKFCADAIPDTFRVLA